MRLVLDAIDVTGLSTLAARGLSKQGQKLLSGLTEEVLKGEAENILKNLSKEDQEIISNTVKQHSSTKKMLERDTMFNNMLSKLAPGTKVYASDFLTDAGIKPSRVGKVRGTGDYKNQDLRIINKFLERNPDKKDFYFKEDGNLASVNVKGIQDGQKKLMR